ncbi:TonB-dependent receptor [Thalassotalea psychrophila]|uniref:TonB-dependent receptor n=1 Tax=Thalassotalea psychrophila TaxID=3065647 RepID=A0ABY9TYJ6_9GAMM|nr:TonB-dependent receptor [Colwelliaceae bacterium SQ149]
MKLKLNTITRCLGAMSLTVALSYPVQAAEVASEENAGLEHITVTSTKRTQSIKDIPMSIHAISGDDLKNESISGLADLSGSVPNLIITETLGTTNVNIRGMGTGNDASFEQSTSLFIDGIYMPRSRQYRAPFMDVERVEVLRGTQAVLFGLNSTAGAISVVSKTSAPEDDFEASLSVDHEFEYGETTTGLTIGSGVTDTLGLRLAVQNVTSDGMGVNTYTGKDINEKDETVVRLTSVWQPTDDLTITAKVDQAEFDITGNLHRTFTEKGDYTYDVDFDASTLPLLTPNELSKLKHQGDEPGIDHESTNVAIDISYDLNDYTLSAIFGYSEFDNVQQLDLDGSSSWIIGPLLGLPADPGTASIDNLVSEDYEQTSFELRLASPVSDSFNYIVGLYYQDSTLDRRSANIVNTHYLYPVFTGGAVNASHEWTEINLDQNTEAMSAFANATWSFTDDMRLTFGARYITEDKDQLREAQNMIKMGDVWVPVPGLLLFTATFDGLEQDRTSDNIMPEAMFQWDANDDTMFYAKAGTSAKSGGFAASLQIVDPDVLEYDDEEAFGLEAGVKGSFSENMGDYTIALFRTEYDDLQVNTYDEAGQSTIQNAATSISQGLEAEVRFMMNDYIMVGGSFAYLSAEYDEFTTGPCNEQETIASGGTCTSSDKSGETMPYAPELSAKVYADIVYPMFDSLDFTAGVSLQYSDEFYTEGSLDEMGLQESFHKINARIGVKSTDDVWDVQLIGKNLNDEMTLGSYQFFAGQRIATYANPMTVNLQATYRFGG